MTVPIVLFVLGLLISFLAFAFAARNMAGGMKGTKSVDGTITGHLGAMVLMAFGGLMSTVGFIWGLVLIVQKIAG